MKLEIAIGLLLLSAVAGSFTLTMLNQGETGQTMPEEQIDSNENIDTTGETLLIEQDRVDPVNTTLSQEEINNILFMREEEKLARDVYLTLYQMYGLQIFENIASSEQRHMDAVLTLIEKYNLTDPVVDEIGIFTNETLQELYNHLIEKGSQNLIDAVFVGALIEEKDIIDINSLINTTNNPDIIQIFTNLVEGSANHLKAFSSQYESLTGESYQPQLLSFEQYIETISSATAGPDNGKDTMLGQG